MAEPCKNGGSAYPRPAGRYDGYMPTMAEHGMSLRDYFAGQAAIGLLAFLPRGPVPYEAAAQQAYLQADAMLAERERTKGGAS